MRRTILRLPSGRYIHPDMILDIEQLPEGLLIMLDTAPVVCLGEALEELGVLAALQQARRHIAGEGGARSRAAVLGELERVLEALPARLQDIVSGPAALLLDDPADAAALTAYLDRRAEKINPPA